TRLVVGRASLSGPGETFGAGPGGRAMRSGRATRKPPHVPQAGGGARDRRPHSRRVGPSRSQNRLRQAWLPHAHHHQRGGPESAGTAAGLHASLPVFAMRHTTYASIRILPFSTYSSNCVRGIAVRPTTPSSACQLSVALSGEDRSTSTRPGGIGIGTPSPGV